MPNRPYTEIDLDLAGHDFLATATVSGTRDPNYANQTHLGDFTLFDLTPNTSPATPPSTCRRPASPIST